MPAQRSQCTQCTVVLVYLVLLVTATWGQVMHKLWTRISELDILQFEVGELRRLLPRGKTECPIVCRQDPTCTAFIVHDDARLCLEDGTISPLAKALRTEGFRYYVAHEGECQEAEGLVRLPGPLCLLLVHFKVAAPQAASGCCDRGLRLIRLDTRRKMNIFIEYLRIKGKESEFSWFVGLQHVRDAGT